MALLDFALIIDQIETYAHLVLFIAAIYYLWLIFKGGTEGTTHKEAWGLGADKGKAAVGWLKEKGHIPFTKEHQEKYKRIGGKHTKRTFEFEMLEFLREEKELKIMQEIKKEVDEINVEKDELSQLKGITKTDEAEHMFEHFAGRVKKAVEDVKKSTRQWKKVKRTTFKQQNTMSKVIDDLKENKDISPSEINKLKVLERDILALHKETESNVAALQSLLESLENKAEEAYKMKDKKTAAFDYNNAAQSIKSFDFSKAPGLATNLVDLQGEGTASKPGVLTVLEALVAETKKLL